MESSTIRQIIDKNFGDCDSQGETPMENKLPHSILCFPPDKSLKTVIDEKGRDEAVRLFGEAAVLYYEWRKGNETETDRRK